MQATTRYEELLAQFAAEFPEFAFWAYRIGQQAILDRLAAVGKSTRTTAELLASASALGTAPGKVRADLTARYQHELTRPVAKTTPPGEVTVPALHDLYVTSSCQEMITWSGATELDWPTAESLPDVWAVVAAHLLSTQASEAPIVLLGQPGAGKSVFTQMLAAGLDPRDFLVVRVELRAVPSDAGVQQQIEAALRELTGRSVQWPDLAEDAGKAQPVIILDGFDELLQASGRSHFDFLERVQEFQDREASLSRPVAVIVTSRTAVANQARADLFVSIHANSSQDPDARGVETYYLNFTSSPEALEVAARENAVSEKSIYELQDLVKKIALKEKIEESREFAGDVQQSLHSGLAVKSPAIRDRGVKKAPFIVLIGANMPSILAEISFVSNPTDEHRLETAEYRQRIAESLYRGIAKYVNGLSGVKVASKMDKVAGQ